MKNEQSPSQLKNEATRQAGEYPVVLFDGVCNLCSGSVQFLLNRNHKNKNLRFASLQSDFAAKRLAESPHDLENLGSIVFIEGEKIYRESTAVLKICKHLDGFWPLMCYFLIIPALIRDVVYRFIAQNRYRWFGKKEACWLPDAQWKERFLD